MKGYSKGVCIKSSADAYFADGGKVTKRSQSDYTPGGNKASNLKSGFAPGVSKAEREDLEGRFGKMPPSKKSSASNLQPVKKAFGGAIKKAVKKATKGAINPIASVKTGMSALKNTGTEIKKVSEPAVKIAQKTSMPKPAAKAAGNMMSNAARGGGMLGRIASKITPAPASAGKGVPSYNPEPMFGRGSSQLKRGGKV